MSCSFNSPNATKATSVPKHKNAKIFKDHRKPCHVGIHWIALTEYSQMSTHMQGFQSFFKFFASFCIGQFSQQQHKG